MRFNVLKPGDGNSYVCSEDSQEKAIESARYFYEQDYAEYTVENDDGEEVYNTSNDESLAYDMKVNEQLLDAMRSLRTRSVPVSYVIGHIQYLLQEELADVPKEDTVLIQRIEKEIELLEEVSAKIENGDFE